jgi:predicted small lipoprotein YifL
MQKHRPLLLSFLLLLIACLTACGQKGPLYRPDERPQEVTTPESDNTPRKKSGPTFPAPQSQKEDRVTVPPPGDPVAPPVNDTDRPTPPAPPSN